MSRLHRQDGVALPVAIMILGIALLLTGFALISAARSNRQTVQDLGEKRALQAADAGLNLARTRMTAVNGVTPITPVAPCVRLDASNVLTLAPSLTSSVTGVLGSLVTGMCAPVSDTYAGGATSTYTVVTRTQTGNPVTDLLGNLFSTLINVDRTIVSVGEYKGVTRRVAMDIKLGTATQATFGNYALAALNDLSLTNGGDRYTSMRSNGNITLSGYGIVTGASNAPYGSPTCTSATGDATPGPGKAVTLLNASLVCGSKAASPTTFSLAYDPISDRATNDNGRLCSAISLGLLTDWCPSSGSASWSSSTRKLATSNGDPTVLFTKQPALTMGGTVYYLCSLDMQGGSHIKFSNPVKIVIDKAACMNPAAADAGTFTKGNNADFISATGKASGIQVYVVGGGAVSLGAVSPQGVAGSARAPFTVYAPDSTATLAGGGITMVGAIAAKSIVTTGGGNSVQTDDSVAGIGSAGAATFTSSNFRECVTVQTTGPLDGCAGPAS